MFPFLLLLAFLCRHSPISASMMCNGQLCDPDCSHCNICDPSTCVSTSTRDCYCPSKAIPGNLPLSDTPQFMIFTFDDGLERRFYDIYGQFSPFFKNPLIVDSLGCHLRPTAYVQTEYADYGLISLIDKEGSIGLHSVTHDLGELSSYQNWLTEFQTCLEDIRALSKVDPKGGRAPNLAVTKNYLQMMLDLGLKYDSSVSYYNKYYNYGKPTAQQTGYWPFTLDFGFPETVFCNSGCPDKTFPGLWEFSMFGYSKADGTPYVCMDYPFTDYNEFIRDIRANFLDNYNANRVPMGMYFHYGYFLNSLGKLDQTKIQMLQDFYGWAAENYPNVVFATESMVIDWMKNPIPFSQMASDPRFACVPPTYDIYNSCNNPNDHTIPCQFPDGTSFLVCSSSCPDKEPGIGVNWHFLDGSPTGKTTVVSSLDPVNVNGTHWIGLGKFQDSGSTSTFVCGDLFFTNPTKTVATSFVLTLELCKTAVTSVSSFWGSSYVSIPSTNKWVYRELSTEAYFAGTGNYAGGWCGNVNKFNATKHLRVSLDLYKDSISSTAILTDLIVYCGDGVCNTALETKTNCPMDCSPLVC